MYKNWFAQLDNAVEAKCSPTGLFQGDYLSEQRYTGISGN